MKVVWAIALRYAPVNPGLYGWVKLEKWRPSPHTVLEEFRYLGEDRISRQNRLASETPFRVSFIELDKTIHDSGNFGSTGDYARFESNFFETEDEARDFIRLSGFNPFELTDVRSVDAP